MYVTAAPDAVGVDRVVTTTAGLSCSGLDQPSSLAEPTTTRSTVGDKGPISTRTMR
jgi:hypothetical protein